MPRVEYQGSEYASEEERVEAKLGPVVIASPEELGQLLADGELVWPRSRRLGHSAEFEQRMIRKEGIRASELESFGIKRSAKRGRN